MAASANPLLSAGVLQLVSTDRSPDREHVARGRGGVIQFHPRTRSRPPGALCFIFSGLLGGHAMDRGRTSGTYARLYGPQPLISFVCYLWTTITLARYDSFAVGFSYTRVHSIDIFYFDTYLLQQVGLIHRRFMHIPQDPVRSCLQAVQVDPSVKAQGQRGVQEQDVIVEVALQEGMGGADGCRLGLGEPTESRDGARPRAGEQLKRGEVSPCNKGGQGAQLTS